MEKAMDPVMIGLGVVVAFAVGVYLVSKHDKGGGAGGRGVSTGSGDRAAVLAQ